MTATAVKSQMFIGSSFKKYKLIKVLKLDFFSDFVFVPTLVKVSFSTKNLEGGGL